MKRICIWVAAAAIVGLLAALPAAADTTVEDSVKTVTLHEEDGVGKLAESPSTAVFWEYPLLEAGQTRNGLLRIVNEGSLQATISLSELKMPTDDRPAMVYLEALQITVTEVDGAVLYRGAYSELVGEDILQELTLQSGEKREYTITLRCPFEFAGDTVDASDRVTWVYKADSQTPTEQQLNPTLIPIFWGVGILLFVLLLLFVILSVVKKAKNNSPKR